MYNDHCMLRSARLEKWPLLLALALAAMTAGHALELWLENLALFGDGRAAYAHIAQGPIVELSDVVHPKLGASIGAWVFAGITPFVRVGAVSDLGMFAELGLHIALPVLRR